MRLSPASRIGPYEIVGPLGAGGMGEVYRAWDARLNRDVAIKVLSSNFRDPAALRRFELEARAAGMLNHPNIVAVYDVGTHDGSPYVVSEFLEGENLRVRIRRGAVPPLKVIDYGLQIAQGLGAAHDKGIIHRDLKPENLFLTKDNRVKILDLGLAKLTQARGSSADEFDSPTEPGAILGTVGYMSPEQVRGDTADHRSDIFSFGAVLYEMVSGRQAFEGDSAIERMNAILKEDPRPLSESTGNAHPGLERIIFHCLEKTPEHRFRSVQDVAFGLESLSVSPFSSKPLGIAQPRRRNRKALVLLGIVAAFIAASSVTAFVVGKRAGRALPAFHQLTFRRGYIAGAARFAPDGQSIVYGAAWDGRPVELFFGPLQRPESRPVGIPPAGLYAVSAAGEMAVSMNCVFSTGACRGTLARVPLVGGTPRELLTDVEESDWSPDGRDLAVVHAPQGRYQLEFPVGKVLYTTDGMIRSVRVSPRGDRIAFFDHPRLSDLSGALAVVDSSGSKKTLSAGWSSATGLAWSPSGDEIWFTADRALYAVTLDGVRRTVLQIPSSLQLHDIARDGRLLLERSSPRTVMVGLAPGAAKEQNLSWLDWSTAADISSDGKAILFSGWGLGATSGFTVYLRKMDGSDAARLGDGKALALSRDGKWALALQETPTAALVLLPTGPGAQKRLPRGNISEYYWASWFPDGKRIVIAASEPGGRPRSYVQDLDGGDPVPTSTEGISALQVSPDGKAFVASSVYGDYFLVPVGGGDPVEIEGLETDDVPLQWSADGRYLYVRDSAQFSLRIYRVHLATGRRELWKQMDPGDPAGVIGIQAGPTGVSLTADGRSYVYTYWTAFSELYLVEGAR